MQKGRAWAAPPLRPSCRWGAAVLNGLERTGLVPRGLVEGVARNGRWQLFVPTSTFPCPPAHPLPSLAHPLPSPAGAGAAVHARRPADGVPAVQPLPPLRSSGAQVCSMQYPAATLPLLRKSGSSGHNMLAVVPPLRPCGAQVCVPAHHTLSRWGLVAAEHVGWVRDEDRPYDPVGHRCVLCSVLLRSSCLAEERQFRAQCVWVVWLVPLYHPYDPVGHRCVFPANALSCWDGLQLHHVGWIRYKTPPLQPRGAQMRSGVQLSGT